ncbi:lipid-A-disaccharide synthase [Zeaxanthinibacter enoshimensis]|uniref:lipid-A-disaccharide synthase n=1 Tax=Zeaxanthinibacter enoshimensis TaxID=392009 RepID=UPI00356257C6
MKYYIIAGEASGDLHGSNLIRELRVQDPDAQIRCWGGDLMQEAGGTLARHYKSMAFMGFFEVIANLGSIFRNISYCKEDIEEFNPDVVIFIDFSGFNLRIAKWAKAKGYRTNYYISPQIWASRENRIKKIKRDIDAMYVILPFEKDFYEKKHDFPVHFVGHPLIDAIANTKAEAPEVTRKQLGLSPEKKVIALLPGSRVQEVQKTLDVMLSASRRMDEYQFVIAGAPSLEDSFYEPFTRKGNVSFVKNRTYELLGIAHAALVTSGTATLETALFNVPQVVCYKGNWISYQIAKRIITLDYISLVNLVMGKEVVKELIQGDLTPANLREELNKILEGPVRQEQLKTYEELRKKLGGRGASKEAASLIIAGLKGVDQ